MKYVIILSFLFIEQQLHAQGFNNNYLIDQQDLLFLFQKNKIQPFKFPFTSSINNSVNILVEEYSNKNYIKSKNLFNDVKPLTQMGDEPFSYYFPSLDDTSQLWIRFYVDETNNDTVRLWIQSEKIQKRYSFKISGIKLTQARAFDDIPKTLEKKEPLFVFYGNRDETLISCPGNASVKEISTLYDFVLVVFAEPFKPN
jgi:hypothetical protein